MKHVLSIWLVFSLALMLAPMPSYAQPASASAQPITSAATDYAIRHPDSVVAPPATASEDVRVAFCVTTGAPVALSMWDDPAYGNTDAAPPTHPERAFYERICKPDPAKYWYWLWNDTDYDLK